MGTTNTNPTFHCCSRDRISEVAYTLDALDFADYSNPEAFKKIEVFSKEFVQKHDLKPRDQQLVMRILGSKQHHLLIVFENIQEENRKKNFLRLIHKIDLQIVDSLYHNLIKLPKKLKNIITPCQFLDIDIEDQYRRQKLFQVGLKAIQQNQVSLLLLAGGSNNRFKSTKYLKRTQFQSQKSILQLIFLRLKKVVQLSNKTEWPINIFIMCHYKTYYSQLQGFLKANNNFGIESKKINIFFQSEIPIVNFKGKIILDKQLNILNYPKGTGDFVRALSDSNTMNKILNSTTKYLCISGLQNMLQKPCDPLFIGELIMNGVDIASKCVDPFQHQEGMLRYAKVNGKTKCLQHSVLKNKAKIQNDHRFIMSPIAMNSVIFKTQYLQKIMNSPQLKILSYSIHVDLRNFTNINQDIIYQQQECYVFQNHIGDLFFNTENILLLKVNRQEEYAPVITQDEQYSFQDAQKMLLTVHNKKKNIMFDTPTLKMFTKKQIQL